MLGFFGIEADIDLDAMRPGQGLASLTARLLGSVSEALENERPDFVLAQGDTTTVLATALASYYLKIPFGHVEAGLRTHRLFSPFPEEGNRVVATHLSSAHFVPTPAARDNLLREGIDPATIHMTGNTVIDALLETAGRDIPVGVDLDPAWRLILVTAHRRDNFGEPLRAICEAIVRLHDRHPDVAFLWPVHPNPAIGPLVAEVLGGRPRVKLCNPLSYGPFVAAMKRSFLILTDSGGVQEEAPALCKPVLILRETSERPESIAAGVARLVGTDTDAIGRETERLLLDPDAYRAMASGASPYGDGRAAGRVVEALATLLGVDGATDPGPGLGLRA